MAAKSSSMRPENSSNIAPMANVTATLIVVFLITMPAVMGYGIQADSTRTKAGGTVVTMHEKADDEALMVSVSPEGIRVNGEEVALADLDEVLGELLASRTDKTVVIVPGDFVKLGDVVKVMDAAKNGGATSLALLDRKEGSR